MVYKWKGEFEHSLDSMKSFQGLGLCGCGQTQTT